MSKTITPGGIPRQQHGSVTGWERARLIAKLRNVTYGRGYRAIRAQDNRHAIIFPPAVANNKQRRVREVI